MADADAPEQKRKRARAIWGFSRVNQPKLAEAAGLHPDRLRAAIGTGDPPTAEELLALARATGIPDRFALYGFEADLEARVQRLESSLSSRRAAAKSEGPPGALDREVADAPPSVKSPKRKPRRKAEGQQ